MTQEQYEKYENEFLKFDRVENKTSNRPDLHALNLLDKLVPGDCDIVRAAAHDQIWLEVTPEQLSAVATEKQIIELIRCGIFIESETYSLSMFV